MRILFIFVLAADLFTVTPAAAQYYINQNELAEILGPCKTGPAADTPVSYREQVLYSTSNNNVIARNTFYKIIGDGDVDLGLQRAKLVGLLNRTFIPRTGVGDTLIVPTAFLDNFCAYAPFPTSYAGAKTFDKLFIIDKSIQAWAAYEFGELARWGIVNTGAKESPTPTGRYNFNWREEYRVSSLSPPGERWEMYWVFNFYDERGIHIHQYPMPTGGPTSHGCVRLVEEDAEWIYRWADPWQTTLGDGFGSNMGKIKAPGTMVLVLGEDPPDNPHPFVRNGSEITLQLVTLPTNPYDVPPGTSQQEFFDRQRAASR